MNLMDWKDISKEKPSDNCLCIVVNVKFSRLVYLARYECLGYFVTYRLNNSDDYPLDITHWIKVPKLP
jgi:hypothetical protein